MRDRQVTVRDMFLVLFKREFYIDMAVFIFVCVPAVLVVLFFSSRLDKFFRLKFIIGSPYNTVVFVVLFFVGWLIIWRAYTYLVFIGEGSPCPQIGGTKKLVTCGPYALVRHPSVIGKLFGVVGLGCLFQATIFTFVVIPILFVWSAFYNRFIQEQGCVDRFKEEYLAYRKAVPMFVPRLRRLKRNDNTKL